MISGVKVGFCGLSDIENQLLFIWQQIMQATQPLYSLQVNLMVEHTVMFRNRSFWSYDELKVLTLPLGEEMEIHNLTLSFKLKFLKYQ